MYYIDVTGTSYPVNFRIYDKREGKTKNEYCREMVAEVQAWGLKLAWVSGDRWYCGIEKLKFLRNEKVGFLFGSAENRKVSVEPGREVQIQTLEIPAEGLLVYLKEFGWVKVFCQSFKNEARYYIMYRPDDTELRQLNRQDFRRVHDSHWQIESFHRVIKQVCNIERFQVRTESAIRTHFFCALQAFCKCKPCEWRA